MTFLPVKARPISPGRMLLVGDSGAFALGPRPIVERLGTDALTHEDRKSLAREGLLVAEEDALGQVAHGHALARRIGGAGALDYLILVPTLRCNLSCSYCQVSRVAERSKGFDWNDRTLTAVLEIIDALEVDQIKIEFQGGEPTLRPDLIRAVIERCERFAKRQFVICTNLQRLDDEVIALFDRPDVFISTSLDGDVSTHARQRTGDAATTDTFLENLRFVVDRYGATKVSALPTVDPASLPNMDALVDSYVAHGIDSVFLRPINYQGFARKRHAEVRELDAAWRDYHAAFVRRLIERNWMDRSRVLEETYFSICLRRVFQPGADRHVDLRDPNPVGVDYVVVDYDGHVYPTDEARMLTRSGVIDLAIGDVFQGWQGDMRDQLNAHATNRFDPTCQRCAYQPFCGRDLIDDLSRYGRIDLPRHETEFCRRHLAMFDLVFELIYSEEPAVRHSLARWLRLPGTPSTFGAVLS